MKSKIIESKRFNNKIIEVFEFKDDFGEILNYSVVIISYTEDCSSGAAEIKKEKFFPNKEKAIKYFNNLS